MRPRLSSDKLLLAAVDNCAVENADALFDVSQDVQSFTFKVADQRCTIEADVRL